MTYLRGRGRGGIDTGCAREMLLRQGGPASSEAEADPDQEHESTCAAVISVVIIVMLILKETVFPAGGEESRCDR